MPEAEPLVQELRLAYDPAAALGVPPHITLNYPFIPGADLSVDLKVELQTLFAAFDPFEFNLAKVARFSDVIYLAPSPARPFIQLIQAVAARYPDSPPYGGAFDTVVPHLTVAQIEDPLLLDQLTAELKNSLADKLPLSAKAEQVSLMDDKDGRWVRRAEFPLGG